MRERAGDTGAGAGGTAFGLPIRPLHALAATLALLASLVLAGTALAAPATTVSLTFDDGRPSQMAAASQLADRGMAATFYIISSQVGSPGVMALSDLQTLAAEGMEIGAHSVSHPNLVNLSSGEAMRQLCLSRNWLMDRGFQVSDMAYPYDSTNASVEASAAACGYSSARSGGQLQCDSGHACAETTPPLDAYALRTPNDFNSSTTLAQMKAAVTNAETHGGGWVPLELHDVCDGVNDPLLPAGAACTQPDVITRTLYTQFIDWLKGEVVAGRVQVKTVHDVVGGALKPETAVAAAPVRTGNLILNPSFETAGANGAPSSCFGNVDNGPSAPPVITTTSDAHDGAHALAISVPARYDSWAYNLISPTLDLGDCAPTAVAGHHYTFTGWYKGNGQIRVVAYWRNADYQWVRLDWGAPGTATFAATTPWAKATLTFQAPAGATAVSAGFYVDGASAGHGYTIDDTSLVDVDAAAAPSALTVGKAGTGSGTVTSSPGGISCGATCGADFTHGASVTLSAVAAPGSSFTGWSGACSGTSTCTVSMTTAQMATATFTLLPVALTVTTAGTGGGAVTSSPAGIDCGTTCQFGFVNGASVTLSAVAASGSSFTGWSGACSGTSTCTVSMTVARSVAATFTLLPKHLTVATTGTGSGTVTSSPGGISCGATCGADFTHGASVTLSAVAAPGSSFTGWSGACSGASTCTVSMTTAQMATATFTLLPVALTVTTAGTGGGAVTSSPAGIDCGTTCQFGFVNGASVTLSAVAASGSSFTGWSGACSGTSTCTVSMTVARSVAATFTLLPKHLTVAATGTGSGTVTSSPGGISCGAACGADFTNGASVTLTAQASAGSSFSGWTGACSGTVPTCTISLSQDRTATATFAADVPLAVVRAGGGSGSVTSGQAGIACGSTCQTAFPNGAGVTLTAVADPGSTFLGWSGACSGSTPTCAVAMSEALTVTATFAVNPELIVLKAGSGTGSVAGDSTGIDCAAACGEQHAVYLPGTTLTLTAAATADSAFAGWSGACSGARTTCTVTLDGAQTVTALFTLVPPTPATPVIPVVGTPPAAADPAAAVPGPASRAATLTAAARPAPRTRPRISRAPHSRRVLVCSRGTWTGSPTRYAFIWRRDGKIVGRAATYGTHGDDGGHLIRCEVTARNAAGGSTASSASLRIVR